MCQAFRNTGACILGRRRSGVETQLCPLPTSPAPDPDDKVASWWDYGYQTTAMANRTVIVDNNTWNNTHIATVRGLEWWVVLAGDYSLPLC